MSSENQGRTVKLFLVDGTPSGIVTAEIMNWTGHVVAAPRSLLPNLSVRPEAQRTGVYLLLGTDPDHPDRPTAYIGETEEIFVRLKQHNSNPDKDFFDRVVVITSKDDTLTKAHAKFLEGRLNRMAKEAANWRIVGVMPTGAKLPESDIADMSFFLRQIEIILPVLGVDLLTVAPTANPTVSQAETPSRPINILATQRGFDTEFVLQNKNKTDARAVEIGGQFVVLKGSYATAAEYAANSYSAHRKRLIDAGKLVPDDADTQRLVFTEDVAFQSPSAASATILNRNDNGRNSWKVPGTGQTYGQWSADHVPASDVTLESLGLVTQINSD